MIPEDRVRIRNWHRQQARHYPLGLTRTGHAAQPMFDDAARILTELAPCIVVTRSDQPAALPGFFIADNVLFSAPAVQKELDPFLETLSCLADPPALPGDIDSLLQQVATPCRLTLFIALSCPHCPAVVRALMPLAARCHHLFIHVVDGTLFPETARTMDVMAAPCLILDDTTRWTGSVSARQVLDKVVGQPPSRMGADALKEILEQGKAEWICQEMMREQRIFDGFIPLLLHDTWSVRLGAMVVVETLAQDDPALAASLCPELIQAFERVDIPVQGDILYALGEAGDARTLSWVRDRLPHLTHPDVTESATEALETLTSRLTP